MGRLTSIFPVLLAAVMLVGCGQKPTLTGVTDGQTISLKSLTSFNVMVQSNNYQGLTIEAVGWQQFRPALYCQQLPSSYLQCLGPLGGSNNYQQSGGGIAGGGAANCSAGCTLPIRAYYNGDTTNAAVLFLKITN